MKILPQNIDSFLALPSQDMTAALIYGPDNGLVKERVTTLSKRISPSLDDPFHVTDFTYETIKDAPVLLADALAALSFFGGRRLVRVTGAPATLPPALQEIISRHTDGAFLIISGGELTPTSGLRKLFETTQNLAAIACYSDEGLGLRKLIEKHLSASGATYDPTVLPYLLQSLAGDRLLITNELTKLLQYMGAVKHIMLEDAAACISGDPLEASLDALCSSVAARNTTSIQMNLALLTAEAVSPIAILRTTSNYFTRLYTVKSLIAEGANENQAMSQLRPPVFFKNIALFQQHVRSWSEQGLLSVIRSLTKLEAESKKTGTPSQLLCNHYLTMIGAKKS